MNFFAGKFLLFFSYASLLFILNCGAAAAAPNPCPTSNIHYTDLMQRLNSFQSQVEVDNVCQNLNRELASLSAGMQGGGFFFGGGGDGELTLAQLAILNRFSSMIVSKIQSILNEMIVKPQCMKENKITVLHTLSSVTLNLTSISAAFSGPYGIPVSIGGAGIASILKSIDVAVRRHNYEYDFDEKTYRDLFATNLCAYQDVKHEIVDLLHPEFRVKAYKVLISELGLEQEQLISKNPLCSEYKKIYDYQQNALPFIKNVRQVFQGLNLTPDDLVVWNHCVLMADLAHSEASDLSLLVRNLPGSDVLDFDYVRRLFSYARSDQGIMKPQICWEKNQKQLTELNLRSSNLISEIIDGTDKSYQKKLDSLVYRGNQSRQWSTERNNLVLRLKANIEKRQWAIKERKKLSALIDDRSFQARNELSQLKQFFDKRLLVKLAPRFLKWFIEDAYDKAKYFDKFKKKSERRLSKTYFNRSLFDRPLSLVSMIERAKNQEGNLDLHYSLYSVIERLFSPLSSAYFSYLTVNQFKRFINQSGSISEDVQKLSLRRDYSKVVEFLRIQDQLISSYSQYLDWCHEKGIIKADGIKTLIEKIKNSRAKNPLEIDIGPKSKKI